MKKDKNINIPDQDPETGSIDQFDRREKTDNRHRDTLNEHQDSTRAANPQAQSSRQQQNIKNNKK